MKYSRGFCETQSKISETLFLKMTTNFLININFLYASFSFADVRQSMFCFIPALALTNLHSVSNYTLKNTVRYRSNITSIHRLPNVVLFILSLLFSFNKKKHTNTKTHTLGFFDIKWVIKRFFSFLLFFRIISFKSTTDKFIYLNLMQ